MPGFFSDNMVLQRDKPVRFWGTAPAGDKIVVSFAGKSRTIKADDKGNWQAIFPAQKAGGVYALKVVGKTAIDFKNITMGDVWLASGQSNMEFSFGNTDSVGFDLIENNNIRFVTIPSGISNYPQKDCRKLEWQLCTKSAAPSFSAVSYYFAQKINKETGVPVGIIHSSWGGTNIRAWISELGIAGIPAYKDLLDSFLLKRNTSFAIDSVNARIDRAASITTAKITAADKGYVQQWQNGARDDSNWMPIKLPGTWQTGNLKDFDGVLWFKKEIDLPQDVKDQFFYVHYGRNLGTNELYINGKKVGTGGYFRSDNRFYLQPNILVPGKNVLVIRVYEKEPNAAFQADAGEMVIQSVSGNNQLRFPISGQWLFNPTLTNKEIEAMKEKVETAPPNTTVSSIYNVKINPLTPLPIKGVLWYQGESDASVGYFYRVLFQQLILDWRRQFKQQLPFIFAQLPSFGKQTNEPVEKSEWAEIRESQAAALSLPNTAMAVTLDVGNPADIHPHNKKPVGERMANAALDLVYKIKGYPLCSQLKTFAVRGNEVHIRLTNVQDKLTTKNDASVTGFAIAGADKRFVWAAAKIVGKDEIVVTNAAITNPVSVRYAWGNSPVKANLVNQAGATGGTLQNG